MKDINLPSKELSNSMEEELRRKFFPFFVERTEGGLVAFVPVSEDKTYSIGITTRCALAIGPEKLKAEFKRVKSMLFNEIQKAVIKEEFRNTEQIQGKNYLISILAEIGRPIIFIHPKDIAALHPIEFKEITAKMHKPDWFRK